MHVSVYRGAPIWIQFTLVYIYILTGKTDDCLIQLLNIWQLTVTGGNTNSKELYDPLAKAILKSLVMVLKRNTGIYALKKIRRELQKEKKKLKKKSKTKQRNMYLQIYLI